MNHKNNKKFELTLMFTKKYLAITDLCHSLTPNFCKKCQKRCRYNK